MRIEFGIEVSKIGIPRFAVEAVEGIGKLFSLAVLVLNVLDTHEKVEIVFHGLNPEDPDRKIAGFKQILESSADPRTVSYTLGDSGRVSGSSSSFQWLMVSLG